MIKPAQLLEKKIGYVFTQKKLLQQALTHRSVGSHNNERLEFLGDSILSFVITNELYQRFPKASEGDLSRYRAALVKGETLAELSRILEIGDYLSLGSGELKSGGYRRDSILADAYEAVIGALYLDGGLEVAKQFILQTLNNKLHEVDTTTHQKDPKTRLQEFLQGRTMALPTYFIEQVEGDAHNQFFTISCTVEALSYKTVGNGSNRRKAEQKAAEAMLEKIDNE